MAFRDSVKSLFGRAIAPIHEAPIPGGRYGFGAPMHIAFTYHEPPTGDANKYVYDTYAVPIYSPIGTGIPIQQAIHSSPSSPQMFARQGVLPISAANRGVVSGQIVTQGLLDLRTAEGAQLVINANARIGEFSLHRRGIQT